MLNNLRKLRLEKNLSQQALGEIIGFSQQAINKYENHDTEPDIATLISIADFFNTSVDFLIGHTSERHKYESIKPYELNAEEEAFINKFRKISPKKRECILSILKIFNEK